MIVPLRRRSRVGALPYADAIQQDILAAAQQGEGPTGSLTQNLRNLGYTMAQISQGYSLVASTSPLAPQVLDYLQRENAYLADETAKQYRMWALLFVAGFGLYLYSNRRR